MPEWIWFDGRDAHMEYAGRRFKIYFPGLQRSAYMNAGFWSSVYAGRILEDTRASAYESIEDVRMKIMLRPLEDIGAPPLYVDGKPVYEDRLRFTCLSEPLPRGTSFLSEYERIKVYRRVLGCFYLCAIARTERTHLLERLMSVYRRARL
jgi:hypothetical protein